jgi:hypothetical protein
MDGASINADLFSGMNADMQEFITINLRLSVFILSAFICVAGVF